MNGATDLKILAFKHDLTLRIKWSGSHLGSGHTSSSLCVRLKMSKIVHLKNILNESHVHFGSRRSTTFVFKVDNFVTTANQKLAEILPVGQIFI